MNKLFSFMFLLALCALAYSTYPDDYCSTTYVLGELHYTPYSSFSSCEEDTVGVSEYFNAVDPEDNYLKTWFINHTVSGTTYNIKYNAIGGDDYEMEYYWHYLRWDEMEHNNMTFDINDGPSNFTFSTEFDSFEIATSTGAAREPICNVSVLNDTHLVFNCSGAGGNNGSLEYNNGSQDSEYLKLVFYHDSPDASDSYSNFMYYENFAHSTKSSYEFDSEISWYYDTDVNATWMQYTEFGYPAGNKIAKVYSHLNGSHQYLIGGMSSISVYRNITLCKAYLTTPSGYLLEPELTYVPDGWNVTDFVQADYYDEDGYALIPYASVAYVLFEGYWYLVPAFSCTLDSSANGGISSDPAVVVQTILVSSQALASNESLGSATYPVFPTQHLCYLNADNYSIVTKTPEAVSHLVQKYYCNGTWEDYECVNGSVTITNINSTTDSFNQTYDTTEENLTEIYYYVGDSLFCHWRDGDVNVFGISAFAGFPTGISDLFLWIPFLLGVGVSTVIPYFIVFPIILNDAFSIVSVHIMAAIIVLVGFTASFNNWFGDRNFKVAMIFTAFAVSSIVFYGFTSGVDVGEVIDLYNDLNTFSIALRNADITTFVIAFPQFMFDLIKTILGLPVIIVNFIGLVLNALFPPLFSVYNAFSIVLMLGLYAYILVKGYEIISNRQLGV